MSNPGFFAESWLQRTEERGLDWETKWGVEGADWKTGVLVGINL